MIGRADIEGSKSDVAMNAWPPQASYPCGTRILRCYSETPARTGGRRPGGQTAHLRLGVPPGPSSETPLSGWADYTIRRLLPPGNGSPEPTHARLVVEPSPGTPGSARELGCGLPIVASLGLLPYPQFGCGRPACFHPDLVPRALGVPRNLGALPHRGRRLSCGQRATVRLDQPDTGL